MAAVYGSSYFWNVSIYDETLKLQQILKGYFTTLTLITGIVFIVLGPFIMFANGIVIAAIWKDPYKQLRSSPSNIIIASMAVSDFLVGLCAIFFQASWFISMSLKARAMEYLGPLAYSLGAFLIGVSIAHIFVLTFDRVIAVKDPLLYKSRVTRKRIKFSVILIWLTSSVIGLLQIPLKEHYYINSVTTMVLFGTLGFPIISFCVIIVYYVKKQSRELKKTGGLASDRKIITERDRKTTKSVLVILAFSGVCFMPFLISWIILLACARCHSSLSAVVTSFSLSFVLVHVNSGINPILYAFRLPKFKKPIAMVMRDVFFCCKPCKSFEDVEPSETDQTPRTSTDDLQKSNDIFTISTKL